MPRFTFARGNAMRLISLPLYGLGRLVGLVVRRQPGLWVFGCGSGVGEGALALYRFARDADPSLRLVWLTRDSADLERARELGIPAIPRDGWRGFWTTLRAQVIVMTHGYGDVNRYGVHGGFVVQLWHGIPLKRIQLDSAVTFHTPFLPDAVFRRAYRRAARAIRVMPAASEVSAGRLRTAFGLPHDRVVVTGDPRDDVLLRGTEESRSHSARSLLEAALGHPFDRETRVLLFAPTWRDGLADPGIPTPEDWPQIATFLDATTSVLLLRPHPHGVGDYREGTRFSERIRMLDSSLVVDVTPILPAISVLITDFSSIAFDFALTERPIAFLAPDAGQYAQTRGLYEPYREFSGGTDVRSWPELLALLTDPSAMDGLRKHAVGLATRVHDFHDGRNTHRVYEQIMIRLRAARR